MYLKFLGRPPESQQVLLQHSRVFVQNGRYNPNGYKQLVDTLVNSDEYRQRSGEQGIPGYGEHPDPGKQNPSSALGATTR